jgi:biotin operon repressor
MKFIAYQERINYLLELIDRACIISPYQIAQKFMCSEKTARNMINTLREQGYEIEYCRKTKKYLRK